MTTPKVGSARAKDTPTPLPDNDNAPLSPRTMMPRVLKKEYESLLFSVGKNDSLCQPVFYIDSFINTMICAIAMECAKAGLPAKAQDLQAMAAQISNALGQVDTYYEKCEFATCQTYVTAAKGNQVLLLAAIDALKQDPDGDPVFSEAHDQCVQLGHKIAALTLLVNERSSQQQHRQQQDYPQHQQQQQLRAPRPSSPRFVSSPERHKNQKAKKTDAVLSPTGQSTPRSPERATDSGRLEKLPSPNPGKRAQGDQDSPQMKDSATKRHKTQIGEQIVSTLSQAASDLAINSLGPTGALSHIKPSSPSKLPKLDWSSAKPVNSASHPPLSTTPRSPKQARSESNKTGKQNADNALSPLAAASQYARTGADGSDHPPSAPTSPASVQPQANPDSPRKALFSPSKPLKAQPRPRPASMLFSSPPLASDLPDMKGTVAESRRGSDGNTTPLRVPPLTLPAASTVTSTDANNEAPPARAESDV